MKIVIDIGGTKIKFGIFTNLSSGKPEKIFTIPTLKNYELGIKEVLNVLDDLCKIDEINCICLGLPGIIDKEKGIIIRSSNLNSWAGRSIKDLLAKRYSSEVVVEHDVVLAGLSELSCLDLLGSYLFVIWGTGFGGVLVEKNIDSEVKTTQIEIGHQIIDGNGLQCSCGQKGCLEAYVGGGQYIKNHHQRLSDLKNDRKWDDIINKVSLGLCNSMVHLSTRNIIMDGGVIARQTWLIDKINKKITSILKVTDCPKISLASHLGDSAIYGGLGLIKKKLPVCSG